MKNYLRYSFVVLMAMLVGNAFSQEVVFDFTDEANPWGFPTEQLKETGTFTKDGKSIVITTTNYTRWFSDSKALLIGKEGATLTLPAFDFDVDKIEVVGHDGASGKVTHNIFVGDEAVSTEVTGAKGTSSFEIAEGKQAAGTIYVLKVTNANNDQICKINIWKKGTTDNPDTPSGSSDLLSLFTIKTGSFSDTENQLLFDFTGEAVLDQSSGATIEVSGKFTFEFENDICTGNRLSLTFLDEATPIAASIALSGDDGYTDVKVEGKTLSATLKDYLGIPKIVIKSMLKLMFKDEQVGIGTLESPLTPNLANIMAGSLANKEVTENDVYIKGKVASIKEPFGAQYGNATFYISIDGNEDFTFYVYRALYLENQKWVEGNKELKVGDEVIVCGKLTNYNGTPETAQGKAYIYSLNGVTKNEGGSETPDTPNEITVAKALEIIAGLEDGKKTSEEYIVKGIVTAVEEISTSYGNATFDIADNAGDATVLKVYRAKDAEGQKITDENIVKVGDTVVVQGLLQKYVKNDVVTPEVAQNGKILTVNGQSTGITIIKAVQADTPLYNLAGQRVDANYKGVVIKNGQKMIQK